MSNELPTVCDHNLFIGESVDSATRIYKTLEEAMANGHEFIQEFSTTGHSICKWELDNNGVYFVWRFKEFVMDIKWTYLPAVGLHHASIIGIDANETDPTRHAAFAVEYDSGWTIIYPHGINLKHDVSYSIDQVIHIIENHYKGKAYDPKDYCHESSGTNQVKKSDGSLWTKLSNKFKYLYTFPEFRTILKLIGLFAVGLFFAKFFG